MPQEEIDKLLSIINNNQHFILTCHTNPDGDALGSTLAMRKLLLNLGKTATVITPDLPPTFYSWMPDIKTVKIYERDTENCDALLDTAEVVFVMDYSELTRVKKLGEKLKTLNKIFVLIDHHDNPIPEVDAKFHFPEAPATCAIVFDVIRKAGFTDKIDTEIATNLYTGILTDTGGLNYNSSSPEIYITVAELLRCGIDKPYIHEKVFNNKNMRRLKLLGYSLSRKMHRIDKLPLAIMALSAKELEQYNYNTGDTEGFVNFPLQVKDIIATALILERPDAIKISIRSKGDFPVNEFAAKYYGGGGHLNAAGANVNGDFNATVDTYRKNIVEFYTKWLKKTANK